MSPEITKNHKLLNPELGVPNGEEAAEFIAEIRSDISTGSVFPEVRKAGDRMQLIVVDTETKEETVLIDTLSPRTSKQKNVVKDQIAQLFDDDSRVVGEVDKFFAGNPAPEGTSNNESVENGSAPIEGEVIDPAEVGLDEEPGVIGARVVKDKLKPNSEKIADHLGWVDRALVALTETGNILTNEEIQRRLLELAREDIELVHAKKSGKNSKIKTELLISRAEDAKTVFERFGLNSESLLKFLQLGLDRLKDSDDTIPEDLTVTEPLGWQIALTRVLAPLVLAPIEAAPLLAGEHADAILDSEMERIKAQMDKLRSRLDTEVAEIQINNGLKVDKLRAETETTLTIYRNQKELERAQDLDKKADEIAKGREAEIRLKAITHESWGRKAAAWLRGVGHIPLAPFEGFVNAVVEYVKEKPIVATGMLAAAGELVIPLVATKTLSSSDISIAFITMFSSPVLQALFDKVIKPTTSKFYNNYIKPRLNGGE